MQSIERYGVIALLFLVVTVVAVLMWDTEESAEDSPSARADLMTSRAEAAAELAQRGPITDESLLEARTEPGPEHAARAPVGSRERPSWADAELAPEGASEADAGDETLAADASSSSPEEGRTIAAERASPREEREPVTAPAAGARPKSERLYLVRAGDTLGEIAQRALGTSRRWPEIAALNPGLDPSSLRVGTRIVLPNDAAEGKAGAAASEKPSAAGAEPKGRTYRVRAGDSLWRIAERELGDGDRWRELVAANRGLNPDKLNVGTVLALPGAAPVKRAATAAAAVTGETVAKTSAPKPATRKGRVQ